MEARNQIVIPGKVADYHCISRCVRRAFLCGFDSYSSKNYEHRREWVRERLTALVDVFGIELVAYAVMNNHLHTIIRARPDIVDSWSDTQVAERWLTIFPGGISDEEERESSVRKLAKDTERIATLRLRLSSVSWFNRCLNENIARRANAEDQVKGRFWEGRFKCQLLQNAAAVLACSIYVDLNPIRAGIATTPEGSDYTSVQDRIRALKRDHKPPHKLKLLPIKDVFSFGGIGIRQYISLVDFTARVDIKNKHSMPRRLAPIVERIGIESHEWLTASTKISPLFRRIIGTAEEIKAHAAQTNRRWYQGVRPAAKIFKFPKK